MFPMWSFLARSSSVASTGSPSDGKRCGAAKSWPRRVMVTRMTSNTQPKSSLLGFWSVLGWVLILTMVILAIVRFAKGLGAVTNLSDRFPWGIWIGFDVLCGVGLAAGGFAITASVHLFHLKDFQPIVRPTVLTAFLGYLLVIVALLFDLGKPWNVWRP